MPPPTSAKSLKTASRRAEALNRLYETDRAHEGHVVWITKNKTGFLHLVQAMARVIGEERNLVGGRGGRSASQLADVQSINRILSISGQICQESNELRSEIADIQRVLGIHRHRLQALSSKEATEGDKSLKSKANTAMRLRHMFIAGYAGVRLLFFSIQRLPSRSGWSPGSVWQPADV